MAGTHFLIPSVAQYISVPTHLEVCVEGWGHRVGVFTQVAGQDEGGQGGGGQALGDRAARDVGGGVTLVAGWGAAGGRHTVATLPGGTGHACVHVHDERQVATCRVTGGGVRDACMEGRGPAHHGMVTQEGTVGVHACTCRD